MFYLNFKPFLDCRYKWTNDLMERMKVMAQLSHFQ